MINWNDAVILLVDHQSGLLQTVKDIDIAELRANVSAVARMAALLKIPVITTASEPGGPNGPLFPEIQQRAPHATHVARKGEINAWDNDDFVKAVQGSGRNTLFIAGVWTSVCVALPALAALTEGYMVFAVIDASGDRSMLSLHATLARLVQAGVMPISTMAMIGEAQKTWNRPDAAAFVELYADTEPHYRALVESHAGATEAAKEPGSP